MVYAGGVNRANLPIQIESQVAKDEHFISGVEVVSYGIWLSLVDLVNIYFVGARNWLIRENRNRQKGGFLLNISGEAYVEVRTLVTEVTGIAENFSQDCKKGLIRIT